jgi:hypothetical protein
MQRAEAGGAGRADGAGDELGVRAGGRAGESGGAVRRAIACRCHARCVLSQRMRYCFPHAPRRHCALLPLASYRPAAPPPRCPTAYPPRLEHMHAYARRHTHVLSRTTDARTRTYYMNSGQHSSDTTHPPPRADERQAGCATEHRDDACGACGAPAFQPAASCCRLVHRAPRGDVHCRA